jgi:Uma2 family endonuclease
MSLADFEHAEVVEGKLYELGRGVIVVSDVPNPPHLAQVSVIRRQLAMYDLTHPKRIHTIAGSGECKILVGDLESERHPDLAIYKSAPPTDTSDVWWSWVPDVVIEVVSLGSEHRDYVEKCEEYLRFGVSQYWIVDAERGEMLVHRRSAGRWIRRVVRPPEIYRTRLLPGFAFDLAAVLAAGSSGN